MKIEYLKIDDKWILISMESFQHLYNTLIQTSLQNLNQDFEDIKIQCADIIRSKPVNFSISIPLERIVNIENKSPKVNIKPNTRASKT